VPRVSIILVRALVEALDRNGVHGRQMLQEAGFDPARLDATDDWLDLGGFDDLIEHAVRFTGDPAFGLHWGERSTLMKYDLMPQLVATARDLRTALTAVLKFQRILNDRPDLTLEEGPSVSRLAWSLGSRRETAYLVRAESGVVGFSRVLQYFSGGEAGPSRVTFDYPAPGHAAEYTRILGNNVAFDEPMLALDFESSLLDVPQVQHNPRIYEAVEIEAERALGRVLGGKQHSELLRQHLFDAFPGAPDMNQVARQLGMAARSLRRRLSEEGTSFQELVVEARVARATRLLEDPRRSIKDTAYAMGFASPSAFHRAFKRWTGVSPSSVRGGIGRS